MREQILLINPAINPSSQNRVINSIINKTFPTSLGTLAAFLASKEIGHVRIIDEQLNFIEDSQLREIILSLKQPRIIGLSVLTINSQRAYLLAGMIKKIDPEAFVAVGGIHPTVVPEEALRCKGIDVVVRGEGEETFSELVRLISDGKDYSNIAGISLRKGGLVAHNQDRPMIMNLDDIPPFPYHLFERDRENYSSFGGMLTSRGCPYNCIFCSSRSVSGKRYRYFSVERVVSEIKLLVDKYGQRTIWLMDDNIAANRQRFMDLLDGIIDARLPSHVHFHGSMRADNISDEILDKAKAVNFKMIAFGMETGSESLMKLIGKGETVKQVVEAVKKTDEKGISVATTIIFGLPGETRKDRWETMKLVRTMPLSSVRFNILTPYPGTPVFELLKPSKEMCIKDNWENFAVQYMWESDDLPYVPKGNDVYELIFDTMFANLSFYFSIDGIKSMLKSSFAGGNVIKVSKKWYFSPSIIWRFVRVILYLNRRFLNVIFRMLKKRIRPGRIAARKSVRSNIEILIAHEPFDEKDVRAPAGRGIFNAYLAKVFENVLHERYACMRRPIYTYLPFNYQKLPAFIRYNFQNVFKTNNMPAGFFPAWPLEDSLERLREAALNKFGLPNSSCFKKMEWPDNKQYSLILTHDIEGVNNWKWVRIIAEAEKEFGFRSSWNVVPNLYRIDYNTLDWLIKNGFEIGLHGFNHDNKLAFLSEGRIRSRIESSRDIMARYNIKGFRSPSWLRSQRLFKVLGDYFTYDCSVPDVDYASPTGIGGCCSIFPFNIGKLVELPTTLPYELPVQFGIAREKLNIFWQGKIEWIKRIGGAVTVITHPDPYYGGNRTMIDLYRSFLQRMRQDESCICILPAAAARQYENSAVADPLKGIYAKTGV